MTHGRLTYITSTGSFYKKKKKKNLKKQLKDKKKKKKEKNSTKRKQTRYDELTGVEPLHCTLLYVQAQLSSRPVVFLNSFQTTMIKKTALQYCAVGAVSHTHKTQTHKHTAFPHMSKSAPSCPNPLLLDPNTRRVLPSGICGSCLSRTCSRRARTCSLLSKKSRDGSSRGSTSCICVMAEKKQQQKDTMLVRTDAQTGRRVGLLRVLLAPRMAHKKQYIQYSI